MVLNLRDLQGQPDIPLQAAWQMPSFLRPLLRVLVGRGLGIQREGISGLFCLHHHPPGVMSCGRLLDPARRQPLPLQQLVSMGCRYCQLQRAAFGARLLWLPKMHRLLQRVQDGVDGTSQNPLAARWILRLGNHLLVRFALEPRTQEEHPFRHGSLVVMVVLLDLFTDQRRLSSRRVHDENSAGQQAISSSSPSRHHPLFFLFFFLSPPASTTGQLDQLRRLFGVELDYRTPPRRCQVSPFSVGSFSRLTPGRDSHETCPAKDRPMIVGDFPPRHFGAVLNPFGVGCGPSLSIVPCVLTRGGLHCFLYTLPAL